MSTGWSAVPGHRFAHPYRSRDGAPQVVAWQNSRTRQPSTGNGPLNAACAAFRIPGFTSCARAPLDGRRFGSRNCGSILRCRKDSCTTATSLGETYAWIRSRSLVARGQVNPASDQSLSACNHPAPHRCTRSRSAGSVGVAEASTAVESNEYTPRLGLDVVERDHRYA